MCYLSSSGRRQLIYSDTKNIYIVGILHLSDLPPCLLTYSTYYLHCYRCLRLTYLRMGHIVIIEIHRYMRSLMPLQLWNELQALLVSPPLRVTVYGYCSKEFTASS